MTFPDLQTTANLLNRCGIYFNPPFRGSSLSVLIHRVSLPSFSPNGYAPDWNNKGKTKYHTFSSECCWLKTIWSHLFSWWFMYCMYSISCPASAVFWGFDSMDVFVASQHEWLCFRLKMGKSVWLSSMITPGLYLLSHSLPPLKQSLLEIERCSIVIEKWQNPP